MADNSENNLVQELRAGLNEDQIAVFNECLDGNKSMFCTGQGGTGKSKVLESVVTYFRTFPLSDERYVSVTASTGIASFLIKGITLHRFAGVGIEESDVEAMFHRASKGASKEYWEKTQILIIDEISMVSPKFFNNLSIVASRIRDNPAPFGGIRLLMFGDFLQLPPVSNDGNSSNRVFHTDAWKELSPKTMQLKTVVRQTSPDFIHILSQLRRGICSQSTENYMRCLDYEPEFDDGIDAVRLFARRKSAEAYNASMLETLDTENVVFNSIDRGTVTLLKPCPAVESVQLKVGCQVILTRNLDSTAVNGSVGVVTSFEDTRVYPFKRPIVKFMDQYNKPFEMSIQQVKWEILLPTGQVVASRIQLPLLLAWAITIHRSQGQTIGRLCVDMEGIFEVGQAYVALSRCPDPSNLSVRNFNFNHIMASKSCIEFYQKLEAEGVQDNLPGYDAPPDYSEQNNDATGVATVTEQSWVSDRALLRPSDTQNGSSQDTALMMGNLSLSHQEEQIPIQYNSLQ